MKITPQLIRKYLNNTCTPQEKQAVDEWYKSFDDHPDPLRFMDEAEEGNLKRSMYNRFRNNIADKLKGDKHSGISKKFYTLLYAVTGMAAVMLLVFNINNRNKQSVTVSPSNLNAQVTVHNGGSSIDKKILPDRSVVWLSPNSTLTYPQKFSGSTRLVSLKGEAFFEVTKDQAHPFIISSSELVTKVWGTSFRVSAYHNSPAEVSVVTGKVSVHQNNKKQEIMLLPNQKVTLLNHRQLVKVVNNNIENEMRIWKKISLSFDDARMSDVFTALNNKFNINIRSTDTRLNNLTFTGDFTDQSLPAILEMVSESVGANYTIEKDKTFVFATNTPL